MTYLQNIYRYLLQKYATIVALTPSLTTTSLITTTQMTPTPILQDSHDPEFSDPHANWTETLLETADYVSTSLANVDYQGYLNSVEGLLTNVSRGVYQATVYLSKMTYDGVKNLTTSPSVYDNFLFKETDKFSRNNISNGGTSGDRDRNSKRDRLSDFEILDLDIRCSICLEQEKNRVLIPCGHCFCGLCLSQISSCPVCRSEINGTMKMFLKT